MQTMKNSNIDIKNTKNKKLSKSNYPKKSTIKFRNKQSERNSL